MAQFRDPQQANASQDLENTLQTYFNDDGNRALGPAALTVGTSNIGGGTSASMRFDRQITFSINGTGFGTKMPSNIAFPASAPNIPTGSSVKGLLLNQQGGQLGTLLLLNGTADTSLTTAEYPARPSGAQVLATYTIQNASGADFDPGVTLLSATGITFTPGDALVPGAWLTPFEVKAH